MQFFKNKKEKPVLILSALLTLVSVACGSNTSAPTHSPGSPSQAPIKVFLPCQRQLSEFEDTGSTLSGTGSGTNHVFRDRNSPGDRYLIKTNKWLEAYASTVYRFFLEEHSQNVCFIEDGNHIHAAVKLEDSFHEAYGYFQPGFDMVTGLRNLTRPLLPAGHGLGGIVVASMLLGEGDLKGLASANSNLGVITLEGREVFYKIDNEQSFNFNGIGYRPWFNLDDLKNPVATMNYLNGLRLADHVTPEHLQDIRNSAVQISQKSRAELEQVLDFCEDRLRVLPAYPDSGFNDNLGTNGVFQGESAPATYKEAVLRRFDRLKDVLAK